MSVLTDKIVAESTNYLGPAAKKFLERQTTTHMGGLNFDDLQRSHLSELASWVATSGRLVIDEALAKELVSQNFKALKRIFIFKNLTKPKTTN